MDVAFAEVPATGDCVTDGCVEDALISRAAAESFVPVAGRGATGFAGGKRTCETAMAMSDRKRARKKRLSIQGTGS